LTLGEDQHVFKLFFHDVGLLGALCNLDQSVLLEGIGIFEEFKGALTEQYVLQQIVAARNKAPMYWSRSAERAPAELDFSIERAGDLIPIEVRLRRTSARKVCVPISIATNQLRLSVSRWPTTASRRI
jgi:predicted AAA+ superfamily ATPase